MSLRVIAVCGLGRVGTVAARLLHDSGFEVVGLDLRRPADSAAFWCGVTDLDSDHDLARAVASCDAVLSCLPYRLNRRVAAAAHRQGIHYFDLTEDVSTTAMVRELGATARGRDGAAVRAGAGVHRHRGRRAGAAVRHVPILEAARGRVAAEPDGPDGLCVQLVARRRGERVPERLRGDRGRRAQVGVVHGVARAAVRGGRRAGGVHHVRRAGHDLRDVPRQGGEHRLQDDPLPRPHDG